MNYLDNEQKQKMEKIFNLQNSIEASKEKQEERITSYDNYLNNNMNNKTEELKMKKLMILKKKKDKKKKMEKKMNDWMNQQNKEFEKNLEKENEDKQSENNNEEENENNEDNNYNYNEQFDVSKYNVVSMDNLDKNNKEENEIEIKEENKEAICLICQRKFASFDKLKLHEKLSELHRQNLEKLKLNNN